MILTLKGEVMTDEWAGLYREFGFDTGLYCPQDVRDAIKNLAPGEELTLEINSIGGMVDAGAEIYSILEACQNPTRAVIQSMAASAASYMIQSCDRIEITTPAQMMIHLAACGSRGNKHTHEQAAQMLDACDRSILDTYCRKCGDKATREQLETLMENETFLTAQDALKLGLVDTIVGSDGGEGSEALVASVTNNLVRAMRVLPDVQDLIARRDNEKFAQLRNELELEKNRFN